jgi:hypothetical protein
MTRLAESFAATCTEEARWRADKAAAHGDLRDWRSADALRAAATWALTDEHAEEVLADLLPAEVDSGTGFLLLSPKAERAFSAYCFAGPERMDRWLRRVASAYYGEDDDDDLDGLLEPANE